MYHILRQQNQHKHTLSRLFSFVCALILSCFAAIPGLSQKKELYRQERDFKPYYFGISLGYAQANLHPSKSVEFLANDSILSAEPRSSGGYSVRLMGTARLSNRFELRFNPGLILGIKRQFDYTLGSRQLFEEEKTVQIIQSNIATFPLSVKFNSDRIDNFKVYMLGGVKYDIDLASNAKARNAENLIKLKASDFGVELGIGFNFFLKYVTVSPEIKFSNGLGNLHARDPNLKYSNVLDQLNSRMVMFTLHLEE